MYITADAHRGYNLFYCRVGRRRRSTDPVTRANYRLPLGVGYYYYYCFVGRVYKNEKSVCDNNRYEITHTHTHTSEMCAIPKPAAEGAETIRDDKIMNARCRRRDVSPGIWTYL